MSCVISEHGLGALCLLPTKVPVYISCCSSQDTSSSRYQAWPEEGVGGAGVEREIGRGRLMGRVEGYRGEFRDTRLIRKNGIADARGDGKMMKIK